MAKGSFWDDLFEKAQEFGASTAKSSTQQIKQTFDPLQVFEKQSSSVDKGIEQLEKGQSKKQNHTPLDLTKLQEKYQNQDQQRIANMKLRLFQMVKSGEQQTIQDKKRKEAEKKRITQEEEYRKKAKEEEKRRQQPIGDIPQGKVRRSIFAPQKKHIQASQQEYKPSTGKQ